MFPRVRARPALWLILGLSIMAAGCVQQQATAPEESVTQSAPVQTPASLVTAGRYADAVAALTLAAGGEGAAAHEARLKAGLIEADLGHLPAARKHWAEAVSSTATAPRAVLAQALLHMDEGQQDEALFILNSLAPKDFDPFEKGLFLRALGKSQLAAGDRAAILNLMNSEIFPMPPNRRTELTHLIWEALKRSDDAGLVGKLDARNTNLPGWLSLKTGVATYASTPDALQQALSTWRLEYPAHPANEMLVDEILELAEQQGGPLRRVALLLPLSGELAPYAGAVRDGFNAMRLASADSGLEIRFYDAAAAEAVPRYKEAVKNGAQLVIGPLDKPGVEALARLAERPVPVLALNSPGIEPAGGVTISSPLPAFSWFALAPEDDAVDLARQAWADGHRRVATLVANTDLGSRARAAFVTAWEQRGGVVVEDSRYTGSAEAYKAAIRKTFSLAQSEARAAFIRRTLNRPIIFEPRARVDVDAIMLSADPINARQIIPQFRYLGVDHLPIYATSQIYGGRADALADADLEGVIFGARPWDLPQHQSPLSGLFNDYWPRGDSGTRQLFAFGMDAYQLLRALPALATDPARRVAGATGTLQRDASGRIWRQLAWARFTSGIPQALALPP
jgi:outer membrane PBP1 activator LpoA protein